ncbi:hypothetical protein [Klebsiella pneumoniae]|uniref:hypothetical protein n=1 Tax=Klebsiella pneumoniae TaxID=573 RepID=UPI00200C3D27|nr:hypothetical protein [Klebsiella pneumoniae]UPY99785.1 hypothetical protein MOV22_26505 [Klebsiella pneumoniae]
MELSDISNENCRINRYGYFRATITIVEGILEVSIMQIADVPMPTPQPAMRILGNVPSHSHAFRTHLHTVLNKFEVTVDAGFWPS